MTIGGRKPKIQYFVENQESEWVVRRDGKRYGPYADRGAALRLAIDAAHASGKNDRSAQVFVQGEDGQFGAVWTYGNDAYPPHL